MTNWLKRDIIGGKKEMKSKEPKCDCANVVGSNQVCDICQGVEKSFADGSLIPDQHLKKEHLAKEYHHEGYLKLTEYPPISWELYPFCNDNYLTIRLPKAPNILYRWMMTLFFGFRWKRIK